MSLQSPLHICHFVDNIDDTETNRQILQNITAANNSDFKQTLVVINKRNGINITLPTNINYLELNIPSSFGITAIFAYQRALRILKPQICQSYGDIAASVLWVARRQNVSLTLHSLRCDSSSSLPRWMRFLFFRLLRRSVDYFTVLSTGDFSWLLHAVNVKKEKIKLLRSPVNSAQYCPVLRQIELTKSHYSIDNISIPANKFVIGVSVNDISKERIFSFLHEYINARKMSDTLRHHSALFMLGNTSYLCELRLYCEEHLPLVDVYFFGFHENYSRFFSQMDAFVYLPPLIHPPTTLLEAMSMGLPIISHRKITPPKNSLHPINWSIQNGDIHIRHQLIDLFINNEKRLALGRKTRLHTQNKHCINKYRKKITDLYYLATQICHQFRIIKGNQPK